MNKKPCFSACFNAMAGSLQQVEEITSALTEAMDTLEGATVEDVLALEVVAVKLQDTFKDPLVDMAIRALVSNKVLDETALSVLEVLE